MDSWRKNVDTINSGNILGEVHAMETLFNIIRSDSLLQAILFVALGLFIAFWPGATIITIIYLFGALFLLSGIASMVNYFRVKEDVYRPTSVLAAGVFYLILALLAFLFPQVIASFFSVALGIILVLCGVVNAVRSAELRQYSNGGKSWIVGLIVGVVIALAGVVVLVNPFETTAMLVFFLGIFLFINGLADLVLELYTRKVRKETKI